MGSRSKSAVAEPPAPAGSEVLSEVAGTDLEALTKTTQVMVGGRKVRVGRLQLNQWLGLAKVTVKVVGQLPPAEVAVLQAAAGTAEATAAGLMVFASLLTEEAVADLYGVLTDLPSKHVRETFDVIEMVEFLEALSEHNDLVRIMGTFRRAAGRWSPPQKT
jgi:hypothetical protein